MRTLAPAAALAIVISLMLGGCVPSSPAASPTPEPSSTPVFASEEEALAAAEEAYAAYLAVSDAILHNGGSDPELLLDVAEGELAVSEIESFREFGASGYRSIGTTTFANLTLQNFDSYAGVGEEAVRVYVCSDVSAVDVFDSAGMSIVSPDRPAKTAFELGFSLTSDYRLILSSKDVWSGGSVC